MKENEFDTLDDTKVVTAIVTDEKYQKESLASKATIAKQVIEILNAKKPSKWLVIFGLSTYLLLLAPLFLIGSFGLEAMNQSGYGNLTKEEKMELRIFNKKVLEYQGLTNIDEVDYSMEDSMEILDSYFESSTIHRYIGKSLNT
ncbi:MAG TPA: hypothetical protein EYG93_10800 [Sulfurospirillum arcachonense]|nr:hypothetical protein [Sulfurospirillum arcachonense]